VLGRGEYLVEGLGHCGSCHSPRTRLFGEDLTRVYDGGEAGGWHAYAIDENNRAPIPWDTKSLAFYLRNGWHPQHGIARGTMGLITDDLAAAAPEDIEAMAQYVASLMKAPPPARTAQARELLRAPPIDVIDKNDETLVRWMRANLTDQPPWPDVRTSIAESRRMTPSMLVFPPGGTRFDPAETPMTTIDLNGNTVTVDAEPDTPLLYVLREELQLNGAKFGCGVGQCGACTVLVEGDAVFSCTVPIGVLAGKKVTTLEGLGTIDRPGRVQRAFIDEQAAQCGYCIPGFIMQAEALLRRTPKPTDAQIREALQPNLCRCGTHMRIFRAVRRAANV
jgi:nicotinate dehydrogenase subunit A